MGFNDIGFNALSIFQLVWRHILVENQNILKEKNNIKQI